jgi:hypothetical protein
MKFESFTNRSSTDLGLIVATGLLSSAVAAAWIYSSCTEAEPTHRLQAPIAVVIDHTLRARFNNGSEGRLVEGTEGEILCLGQHALRFQIESGLYSNLTTESVPSGSFHVPPGTPDEAQRQSELGMTIGALQASAALPRCGGIEQ